MSRSRHNSDAIAAAILILGAALALGAILGAVTMWIAG